MKVDRLILRRKLASFLFCRQTIQNRRILSNVLAQAVITRTHDAHLWHETRPRRIQHPLGAMGEVCNARDHAPQRTVAVKILPSHLSKDPEARQCFDREADNLFREPSQYLHSLEVGDQISRLKSFYLTLVPILL